MQKEILLEKIRLSGYNITSPITDLELANIYRIYGITFPKDLLELYKLGVPTQKYLKFAKNERIIGGDVAFYNWHDFSEENIKTIKHAMQYAYINIKVSKDAPLLIPIAGHRYMPMIEGVNEVPVLSICGLDAVVYGKNLEDYILREIEPRTIMQPILKKECEYIPFWTDYIYE